MKKIRPKSESSKNMPAFLSRADFGERGVEGKIKAIEFCRKNKIPYFGLCYGMQLLVIEYARNVLKLKGANTTEINRNTKYPVIDIMPEQKKNLADKNYGATMRLGAYPAILKKNTIAYRRVQNAEYFRTPSPPLGSESGIYRAA